MSRRLLAAALVTVAAALTVPVAAHADPACHPAFQDVCDQLHQLCPTKDPYSRICQE